MQLFISENVSHLIHMNDTVKSIDKNILISTVFCFRVIFSLLKIIQDLKKKMASIKYIYQYFVQFLLINKKNMNTQ